MLAVMSAMTKKAPPAVPAYSEATDPTFHVEIAVNDEGRVVVYHNKEFQKKLSWLEFDLASNKLDFVTDDGDLRDFGMPVDPRLAKNMQNTYQVEMVLMNMKEKKREKTEYCPLIVHRA